MISNKKNEGNREFKQIVLKDIYRVQDYPKDYFDYIIDIGANIGMFSVMMRMFNPNASIYAIEPCQETFSYLVKNVNMFHINIEQLALGDGSKLYFKPRAENHLINHMFVKEKSDQWAQSITLYDLFNKHNLDLNKRFILKLDCEGGEKYLMETRGSESIMKKAHHISIEVHFQSPETPFSHWLTYTEYNTWIRSTFEGTHDIDYYCSSKKRGYGHYCLKKKDA